MATESNLSQIGRAKTIGEMNPVPVGFGEKVKELLIPTEHEGVNANFRVSILDILRLISRTDIGLDKIDNTSDEDKPISRATQLALDTKFDKETDTAADIQGLQALLEKYRLKSALIPQGDVGGLMEAIDGLARRVHSHSRNEAWLANILEDYAAIEHSHRLNTLVGWSDFSTDLQAALSERPTRSEVDQAIDNKLTSRNVLEVKEFSWGI